ncbi:hypothetical protein [Streptomyces sp. NPDC047976]|uniref:hypothetical protein n=1 Tax=unclassified Streptomyces TaxID=2593676 RepID=UPI00343533DF
MPSPELPRRPLPRQLEARPEPPIPWDAFAVNSDVTAPYGQPSAALIERARRGWKRLGNLHGRLAEDGTQ